jgi:hypothetical protein
MLSVLIYVLIMWLLNLIHELSTTKFKYFLSNDVITRYTVPGRYLNSCLSIDDAVYKLFVYCFILCVRIIVRLDATTAVSTKYK